LCFSGFLSEQAGDLAVGVHIDVHGGGLFGQAGHGQKTRLDPV
jgi:ribosomal protein S9